MDILITLIKNSLKITNKLFDLCVISLFKNMFLTYKFFCNI